MVNFTINDHNKDKRQESRSRGKSVLIKEYKNKPERLKLIKNHLPSSSLFNNYIAENKLNFKKKIKTQSIEQ